MTRGCTVGLAMVAFLAAGCGDDDAGGTPDSGPADAAMVDARMVDATAVDSGRATATSTLAPKSGNTTLAGTITFTRAGAMVNAVLTVTGAPPGMHGVHIHAIGDCSAIDAASAGGHWNPANVAHGLPTAAVSHAGDMGNMTVDGAGMGTLSLGKTIWRIGDSSAFDVVGKAIVVHSMADDGVTQPTGNSGSRIGCGVIQ